MIPWFIVNIIGAVASLFGRDVYVRARSGGWGAERIYFQPLVPGTPRTRRLAPYRVGPLTAASTGIVAPAEVDRCLACTCTVAQADPACPAGAAA